MRHRPRSGGERRTSSTGVVCPLSSAYGFPEHVLTPLEDLHHTQTPNMPTLSSGWLAAAIAISSLVLLRVLSRLLGRHQRLPPGPKGWPLVGNIFDFPTTDQARAFRDLAPNYGTSPTQMRVSITHTPPRVGDMTHFNVFGQHIVVLNSHKVAQDLLDKRSGIYSDRPPFVMGELYVPPHPPLCMSFMRKCHS